MAQREAMTPRDLPFDVLAFLQERINGTDELAALLLIRSDASRGWIGAAVAEQLDLPRAWAGPALEGLCDAGLLVADETEGVQRFWYRPATPALESVVTVVAEIYDERRSDVLRILNDTAVERIRAAAARTFGGAFEGRSTGAKKRGAKRGAKKSSRRGGSTSQDGGREREQGDDGDPPTEQ
jgi:hypothetical protein